MRLSISLGGMNKTLKHTNGAQPHSDSCGYIALRVDETMMSSISPTPVANGRGGIMATGSEGGDYASCVGCNANNGNAGRNLNANNAATNTNDNFAGGFANMYNGIPFTSQPTRLKIEENRIANGGYGQNEYELLPYWGDNAESGADLLIWDELKIANKKRKLKSLRRFYLNRDIVEYAIRRTCKKRDTKAKSYYYDNADEIAKTIISDIENGTYKVRGYVSKEIPRRHKTDKVRTAKIYSLYDRCVQNLILTIIEQKLKRKVVRNNYSNIDGRGILCRDRRFCMMTRIRHASSVYRSEYYLTTDIKKFYESVPWKVLVGSLFDTIKDKTTRWLLIETFKAAGDMPIGCCLSPIFSDLLMGEHDNLICKLFNPSFFAAFGDNRIYISDKRTIYNILGWSKSFYEGRYGISMKNDWQIERVFDGFRFCKTWYDKGFVRIRGEMRRRAIKNARNPQSFAGYNGLLIKSDSVHLRFMIRRRLKMLKSRNGIATRPFAGDKVGFDEFVGKRIAITDFRKIDNKKDSGYYYDFQIVSKKDGVNHLFHSHNGSFEIKEAGDLWLETCVNPPIYVTVRKEGNSFYFEE